MSSWPTTCSSAAASGALPTFDGAAAAAFTPDVAVGGGRGMGGGGGGGGSGAAGVGSFAGAGSRADDGGVGVAVAALSGEGPDGPMFERHTMACMSTPLEAKKSPSGEKAHALTPPSCPCSVQKSRPSTRSQTLSVASSEEVSRYEPELWKERSVTLSSCAS